MNEDFLTYLGIDWGSKRIGLAIGDSSTRIASPFKVVASFEELLLIIIDEEIDAVVIGEPLKMKDSNNNFVKEYIEFVERLESDANVEIIKVDERLTSKHADSLVGTKKTKASRDAIAAMLILQAFLDREKRLLF